MYDIYAVVIFSKMIYNDNNYTIYGKTHEDFNFSVFFNFIVSKILVFYILSRE
jgi:hypothetical protein